MDRWWFNCQINVGLSLGLCRGVLNAVNQTILVFIPELIPSVSGLLKIRYFKKKNSKLVSVSNLIIIMPQKA